MADGLGLPSRRKKKDHKSFLSAAWPLKTVRGLEVSAASLSPQPPGTLQLAAIVVVRIWEMHPGSSPNGGLWLASSSGG